ncbi:tRNA (32-2'-O)-methyltransferase regulator THADA [Musca vetustissima]|uniref:tRNA (32-2'-O)-methyltransferase regulator THADA n=1 Tax=Musca vetustissima TaxID=27455 RepID=UPI002AB74D3E|nr:tRNA (32-2'-O)-methyltransferase regulator THADA [Musca vetustissima]
MNALNLRVSSVKNNDNVRKNAEMRAALVKLPATYQTADESYCLEFRGATTVPDQVACVKRIFESAKDNERVLQFLCDLHFSSPLKHPVRNQIVKLLVNASKINADNLTESIIVKSLASSIQTVVLETKANSSSLVWNTNIVSLSGCFENFECGRKALGLNIDDVFSIIYLSVGKYLDELKTISSPSVRNEYYMYVHNSVRILLTCSQEFGGDLKTKHNTELRDLEKLCLQIVLDGEIPMDPRTNAGMLMANIAKLFDEYPAFVLKAQAIQNPNEIALCVGVINTANSVDFQKYSNNILHICGKIDEIANANATVPNILLCATRALFQISKLTLQFALGCSREDGQQILQKLMAFSVAFMEHHMDSVRHLCRDLMRNVVAAAKKLEYNELITNIYEACNSDRLSLAVKCVILQQVSYVLGAENILENCKTIFSKLFTENLGKDFIVNNLYEALMMANYKEQSFDKWCSTWIGFLLNIACCQDSRLADVEALIVKAVKCDSRVVQSILFAQNSQETIPISTKLSTLWAVRKSGIKIDNYEEIMQQFSQHLQLSILSNDNETRIMAVRLLVETHKTTEPLTQMECELLIVYLQYNVNTQCPATRHKSLGLLTKALSRCHVGVQKFLKGKQASEIKDEESLDLKFLKAFMKILVENLFEGANFSRRSVSLQLLQQCFEIVKNCGLKLLPLLPKETVKVLYETLKDSYESNNELAVNMLKLLQDNADNSDILKDHNLEINLNNVLDLLTSVRPTDSVTASYQMEFLCHRGCPSMFGDYNLPQYSPTYFAALKWLYDHLKDGLEMARLSILEAAKMNPLYGILLTIKHLLARIEFSQLAKETVWRNFVTDLINICKDLTDVVSPIVNSSSPEGHLPNDFGEFPENIVKEEKTSSPGLDSAPCKILSSKLRKSDLISLKTTPQMVLLCAWRTVKEVSLILGYVVLNSPIQFTSDVKEFLISKEQILDIGEHFKLLLSETKHRGAFEQAYVGFSKLCCRLWTVEYPELNTLPMMWLKELISLISQEDVNNGKICATRRSAGVPFMVQALITSELKVGSIKSLAFCMKHLLELAACKENSSESRTHALNILRALFRCSDLNEAVGEYVSQGITAAINGYDARNWSEKNSATLLFASLMTRIFGVQRTKDTENLNIRNKMTGRVFFLRYPKLYDFFLEELQKASELILRQQKAHKLHPLLLVLSRLYVSALEGTESNLKLSQFIPYVSECGGCPELQTRYLAAKAIAALVNKDEVSTLLREKCAEIVLMTDGNAIKLNRLHGYILQIYFLLKNHKGILNEELITDISSTFVCFHKRTGLQNAVILKTILDIFIEMLNSLSSMNVKRDLVQQLTYFSTLATNNDPKSSFYYTVQYKTNFLYNLHNMRLTLPAEALSDYILEPPVTLLPLEQAETCLNIILLALAGNASCDEEMLEEFEILPNEVQFIKSLDEDSLQELSSQLRNSKALEIYLKKLIEIPKYYPEAAKKAYAILSQLHHFDFSLSQLLEKAKKHKTDVKSSLTMCVERVLQKQGVNYDCAQKCLEYLIEIANPSQPYYLRIKAANSLKHIAIHYPKCLELKRLDFISLYIKLVLDLLMDDDYDIRDASSKLIVSCLATDINLYLGNNWQQQTLEITPKDNMVSTVVQRLFLQYSVELLLKYMANDDYILEIFNIIVKHYKKATSNGGNDDSSSSSLMDVEIFDKSEANDFSEPFTVIKDAVEIFTYSFQTHTKVMDYLSLYQ